MDELPPTLREVLTKLDRGEEIDDRELASALSTLRREFTEISEHLLSGDVMLPVYRLIQRGVEAADEDLFLACEEHDSLRRLVYKVVKMMDPGSLERASKEILSRDLERTLLGAFVMRRVGGRGGGT